MPVCRASRLQIAWIALSFGRGGYSNVTANNALKRFYWVAFAVFLLASISHVAYFFRAFEPQDSWLYWWIVAYAIAISVDMTIFLLSLSVAELRRRQVN